MRLLKENWKFHQGFSIISPPSPQGALFNVVGIPTWNSRYRRWGYGGVGETAVTYALERYLGQETHDDAGGNTRHIIAARLGGTGAVDDAVLSEQMAKLVRDGDPSVDYEVDNRALNFALELLQTKGVACVGTKILNLLTHHCESRLERIDEFLSQYALVTIAVTADDTVATWRKIFAGLLKGKEQSFKKVEQDRILRLPKDVAKFRMAYPWLNYSRELILRTGTTVIVDNTKNRTNAEMDMYVESMLCDITCLYPELARFLKQ